MSSISPTYTWLNVADKLHFGDNRVTLKSPRQLSNGDQHSLDFTYNRMCMKLFKSLNIDLVHECQSYLCCVMPITVRDRSQKFIAKYDNSDNAFYNFL